MASDPNIYIPSFPYKGAQIVVTSDRVVIYSKNDSIFLFGKKAIGLSSPGRINIDTNEGTTVNAPEIELGLNAKVDGEPITKATTLITLLADLLVSLESSANSLSNLSATALDESIVDIVKDASNLRGKCNTVRSRLQEVMSKITYTL